ncbi:MULTISPECIES: helix-turn-helix transcriptional regulator [unclassified Oceanobacillus]|uniref:helix-turn-helix transcriptional regulator n=1 Tax=unclassified Oceanobacillus TaxID=2630292 RepID=UPI00300E3FE5
MSFNQKRKINNRIVVLRAERGLSQRELANQLGVSRQTIISLEKNRYNPSLKLAFDIALFFGVVRMIANRIIRSIHSTFRL